MMAASMKAFFDTTGGLWQSGGLVGKPAGLFTSSGTQGGCQDCGSGCGRVLVWGGQEFFGRIGRDGRIGRE
jgi:multimeric flavodoxin WrbA